VSPVILKHYYYYSNFTEIFESIPGSDFVYTGDHLTHSDSCATVLFQGSEEETRANCMIELMDQLAYESCYTQLRTKEQLGVRPANYMHVVILHCHADGRHQLI